MKENTFSALDIANFYVQLSHGISGDSIDNLKLNKILFFAQGWSLVKLGRSIYLGIQFRLGIMARLFRKYTMRINVVGADPLRKQLIFSMNP